MISLVPNTFLPFLIECALECNKHLVSSSYNKPSTLKFHKIALKKDLTILNECGLDPGIDHIVTMKIIDEVRAKKGKIISFLSSCGALMTPESLNNPLNYKFTWSPIGVLRAISESQYLENGKIVKIANENFLYSSESVEIQNLLKLVEFPNRDSLKFQKIYNVPEAINFKRGTYRYHGFEVILSALQ